MDKYSRWDYRTLCNETGECWFIEVYYDEKSNILDYSDAATPYGQNIKDLEFSLEKMAEALNKPTLFIGDLPKDKK